jgi:hypothetical protein
LREDHIKVGPKLIQKDMNLKFIRLWPRSGIFGQKLM